MSLDPPSAPNDRPAAEGGDDPIRTLLRTAATVRPLEEVVALVSLLKRTGEFPGSGDEALRAAADSRPVDEVRQLVALLNEPPHEVAEADTTPRAAAVGRPIENVAPLVNILGSGENDLTPVTVPAVNAPTSAPVPVPVPAGVGADVSATARHADDHPEEEQPRDAGTAGQGQHAQEVGASGADAGDAAASRFAAAYGNPLGGPRGKGPAAGDTTRRPVWSPLHSVLRWPAAAALLVISVIHLPADSASLRSSTYADGASQVVAVVCLVLAILLVLQDAVLIWAAGAATAVAVLAARAAAASVGSVDMPANSLGDSFALAAPLAVVCAVLVAAFAGSVLLRRRRTVAAATDA